MSRMDIGPQPVIVTADRLNEGLVVLFHDGRCAFYSASLLYEVFLSAIALDEPPWPVNLS